MAKLKAKPPEEAKARKPIILIYGVAGVGKSTGALEWPKPYYIDTEGGASRQQYLNKLKTSGGVYLGPEDGAGDLDLVTEQIQALATTKHPYLNVVVDSLSKPFNTSVSIRADEMEDAGKDMDKTFGKEKKGAIRSLRRMIRWIEKADIGAVLICHEKDLWKKSEVIGTTFDCWDKLSYELDLVLQIVKHGPSRKAVVMKTRVEGFPEGSSFDWNYATFARKYGEETMDRVPEVAALATQQQVDAINALLKVVRLDEDTVYKWFEKAGVEAWSEMDTETIQACVDYLTNKLPKPAAVA